MFKLFKKKHHEVDPYIPLGNKKVGDIIRGWDVRLRADWHIKFGEKCPGPLLMWPNEHNMNLVSECQTCLYRTIFWS